MAVRLPHDFRDERRYGEPEGMGFWRSVAWALIAWAGIIALLLILTTSP